MKRIAVCLLMLALAVSATAQQKRPEFIVSYPDDPSIAPVKITNFAVSAEPYGGGFYSRSEYPSGQMIPLNNGIQVSLDKITEVTFVTQTTDKSRVSAIIRTSAGTEMTELLVKAGEAKYVVSGETDLGRFSITISDKSSKRIKVSRVQ